jgi:hypothetical protein
LERGVLVQRSTDDHLALYVDAVDLKDSLRDIEKEPSTASQADSCTA